MIQVCMDVYIKRHLFFFTGVPVVSITYSADWIFLEIQPSNCNNISIRLVNLKEELEEAFAKRCQEMNINATVQFRSFFYHFYRLRYIKIHLKHNKYSLIQTTQNMSKQD